MATRAASFTAKIRNLKDFHYRMVNNLSPLPSGVDIANTLKYFSQTLLSVLKDVPPVPSESHGPRQRDSVRLSVFPNLNYSALYDAVLDIMEVVPSVQHGQHVLGECVLLAVDCLVPFIAYDLLDSLPYTVAATLAVFPSTLHPVIVRLLATSLLPATLGYAGMSENPTYATESTAAILMLVFQHVSNEESHSQICECIMSMKKEFCKDLLCVIAYGPAAARAPAANLLFHYWPQMNPALFDRRGIHYKCIGFTFTAWQPPACEMDSCIHKGNVNALKVSGHVNALKVCLDPTVAVVSGERPPPLHICSDCADCLQRARVQHICDIIQPMRFVSLTCDNKNCMSAQNTAVCTCFSVECASANGRRPMRYCEQCHVLKHPSSSNHIWQYTVPDLWRAGAELQTYLVEAIVSLLKEAQPLEEKRNVEMGDERCHPLPSYPADGAAPQSDDGDDGDEGKRLSRYGIWLLMELCQPSQHATIEVLGRLLAMLFQWFDATAYLPDDNVGNAIERLKPQYICKWLQEISITHFEVIVSCLLPHPVEYARVGGHWDTLSSRTSQIKEGLNRLCCLIPYDIVSFEVWDYIIPFWLEAIRTEVPETEQSELRVLLCKVFDIDMSPLPFGAEKMYHFIIERFELTMAPVQEQNLCWLQILTRLGILIPLPLLLRMFGSGLESLRSAVHPPPPEIRRPTRPHPDDGDGSGGGMRTSLADALFASMDLPDGVLAFETPPVAPDDGAAADNETCFVMMLDLLIRQIDLQGVAVHQGVESELGRGLLTLLTSVLATPWQGEHVCAAAAAPLADGAAAAAAADDADADDCRACEMRALWHQMAARLVAFVVPPDAVRLPRPEAPPPISPQQIGKLGETLPTQPESEVDVKADYDVSSFPVYLQFLHGLLKDLEDQMDPDALYYLLLSLRLLVLHAVCLDCALRDHEDFVKHCLRVHLIPNIWKLLQAEYSQIAAVCVPLLLHCIVLPSGGDVFWKLTEEDFSSESWQVRFAAVEKVTVLARLIKADDIDGNQPLMTSLTQAFCFLIGSISDLNSSVVQQTKIYLQTIKKSAIWTICTCLEFQFDSVIKDRTMILHKLLLLSTALPDAGVFTWDFFLNRFDTLCLEAQLDLESNTDPSCMTDLRSTDRQSVHFLQKINRARLALARTSSIRSVSLSALGKYPYRRAASVPMHLLSQNSHGSAAPNKDKEKAYIRQQSAPQFRHRGSRFGLGSFASYMFPGGSFREFTDEQSSFSALLQRAMELEGVDRETIHQLVTLLMKFMLHTNQEKANEERNTDRLQNLVLRHLNVLLGYIQTAKSFSVPPYKLRYSAVFNAYLSGLPKVLDKNFLLGNIILPVALALLQYCPSPQRYASDYQPPNYTLWYLEPHTRHAWLQALLVILYKYQYNTSPASSIVQTLVRITINTVDAQIHRCRVNDDAFSPMSPMVTRHRDTSTVSAIDLENIEETDTPPQSPLQSAVTFHLGHQGGATVHYTEAEQRGRRIAEYDRRPTATEVSQSRRGSKVDDDGTTTTAGIAKPEVAENHRQQRTLEESVREFMHVRTRETDGGEARVGGAGGPAAAAAVAAAAPVGPPPQTNVDRKIVEQIEQFESQTKPPPPLSPSSPSPPETDGSFEKRFEVLHSPALPDVQESAEEGGEGEEGEEGGRRAAPGGKTKEEEEEEEGGREREAGRDAAQTESELEESPCVSPVLSPRMKPNYRQRKMRKTGLTTVELQKMIPELGTAAAESVLPPIRRPRRSELLVKTAPTSTGAAPLGAGGKRNAPRPPDPPPTDRCPDCCTPLEQYDEETIGLCIIAMATFVYREPPLAAPLLHDTLQCVARIAGSMPYPWQAEISGLIVPGNSVSVARQFLRCVLHQLAPNGIFPQMFQTEWEDDDFLKTVAAALADFADLNCFNALQLLLEGVTEMRSPSNVQMMRIVVNLATFLSCMNTEMPSPSWSGLLTLLEVFLRRLPSSLPCPCETDPLLHVIMTVLKIPGVTAIRGLMDSFTKILSFIIQHCSFKLQKLLDICSLCSRAFSKERDRLLLPRSIVFELVQAIKFKVVLPDENLLQLVQLLCMDAGGTIGPTTLVADLANYTFNADVLSLVSSSIAECMKQHLAECIEFVMELHTINRVKANLKGSQNLNEDTLGGQLKAAISQYIALELTQNAGRDNRALNRYLPWLFHPPSTMQQGPREFVDCVGHIRLLSWLLLGSLTHTAITQAAADVLCQPLPLLTSSYIADHILLITTGFAEQSKASVLHMSSLFHAFILCQLWTMYCECYTSSDEEDTEVAQGTIMDFWARVTPGILQLLSHSKVLSEMVNLHFLSLIEALQECKSVIISKLFAIWTPILFCYHSQLPGHMQVRLQICQNCEPRQQDTSAMSGGQLDGCLLLKWLHKLQFKLSQIEVQSSAATQFYVV